jgi:hypothetical protein
MRTISPMAIIFIAFCAIEAFAANIQEAKTVARLNLDARVSALAPLTWTASQPAQFQGAWDLGIGAELQYGTCIPLRLDAAAFSTLYSFVDSSGRLVRALSGTRFSLSTGCIVPIERNSLGFLIGASLSAAQYQGTALLLAYPSALAELRFDMYPTSIVGFRASLPLELMFRGGTMTFAPGLRIGIRVGRGERRQR